MNLNGSLNETQGKILGKDRKREKEAKEEQHCYPMTIPWLSRTITTSAWLQNQSFHYFSLLLTNS